MSCPGCGDTELFHLPDPEITGGCWTPDRADLVAARDALWALACIFQADEVLLFAATRFRPGPQDVRSHLSGEARGMAARTGELDLWLAAHPEKGETPGPAPCGIIQEVTDEELFRTLRETGGPTR